MARAAGANATRAAASSSRSMTASLVWNRLHVRRQIEGYGREGYEDREPAEIGNDERNHTLEDGREIDVLHHALDDEHDHADRRMDEPELHRHNHNNAEPDRVKAELLHHREDDRHR